MIQQLSLEFDREINKICSVTTSVTEQKIASLIKYLESNKTSNGFVEVYEPGNRRGAYFRYSIRIGKRIKHYHICGGNISNQLAQNRAIEIKELIDKNYSYYQILEVIKGFSSKIEARLLLL